MESVRLNPEQQKVVNHIHGALLVLAPVGTGKTSVLTQRVAQAISHGIDSSRILCLTFTNRAAKEMSDRLAKIQPQHCRQIGIRTFHGFCAYLLRVEFQSIGLPADFVVYDDSDCFEIIKKLSRLKDDKDVRLLVTAIAECKAQADKQLLTLGSDLSLVFSSLDDGVRSLANRYQKVLNDRHAIDFADLVFYTRAVLSLDSAALKRWQNCFDFIQVDEVQDTHPTEYEVVRSLANEHGQIALIGDLDQTIYEWRGSDPSLVLQQFKIDFAPEEHSLTLNYRATKTLLNVASAFADSFEQRRTSIVPAMTCIEGNDVHLHEARCERSEAAWIAHQVKQLAGAPDFCYSRTAILARTNRRAEFVAKVLAQLSIPCITVEQYQFFMRKEIKDVLAYLKFIVNPFDTGAFKRLALTPARGISFDTLRSVYAESRKLVGEQRSGLRLIDFASAQGFIDDDPLGRLLQNYSEGSVVVFDVETTGISINDDVIEIAAIKLVNGQPVEEFREYISDAANVGDSQNVHGYSDELLRAEGKPAKDVFVSFCRFVAGSMLVGHNVGFDITKVTAHAQKVGLQVPSWESADTWDLSQRFLDADSYSLGNLVTKLNLLSVPNHQAMDDVRATVDLLAFLIPLVREGAAARQAIVHRYGEIFESLSKEIIRWRTLSKELRPVQLLIHVIHHSGLERHYSKDLPRVQNLQRLVRIFQSWDDLGLQPDTALKHVLERTALAKNLDQISEQDNQVVVITAHQSKGLEFDNVFIAGVSEGEFPEYRSIKNNNLEEEKRTFYVALTRAKERLFISYSIESTWRGDKLPSRFLQTLPRQNVKRSSSKHREVVAS